MRREGRGEGMGREVWCGDENAKVDEAVREEGRGRDEC